MTKHLFVAVAILQATLSFPLMSIAASRQEPGHVALIIGNSRYAQAQAATSTDPNVITFPGLPNACNDAQSVAASLVSNADWKESEIIQKCDLSASAMLAEVRHFANLLRSRPGSVGMIYFSGHGAQVADHNYLFGVDAHPNIVTETSQFIENPDAPLFVEDAIDLHDDITREVGNVTHGALLVIVDACRTNPLLARIASALNNRGGGAGGAVVVSAPSSSTGTVPGIVIGYSTRNGKPAPDGSGATSPYAGALSRRIASGKQIVNILSQTSTAVYNDSRAQFPTDPQNPTQIGNFSEPPSWCFSKCPDEEGQSDAAAGHPASVPPVGAPMLRTVGFAVDTGQAAAWTTPLRVSQPASDNEIVRPDEVLHDREDARLPRGVSSFDVDIYWCMGGSGEDERHRQALRIGQSLIQRDAEAGFGGHAQLLRVRVRPLSIQANSSADYRFEDNIAVLRESPVAKAIAEDAKEVLPDLTTSTRQSSVAGLYDLYLCKRSAEARSAAVYVQYPSVGNGKVLAISAVKKVSSDNPQLNLVDGVRGIEGRRQGTSPKHTEVRFYNFETQLGVFDAARSLEELLGHKVLIKYMPRLTADIRIHPIEIWIGEEEPKPTSSPALSMSSDLAQRP
jgi:hypothetical protein